MPEPLKTFPIQLRRTGINEIVLQSQGFPRLGEPSAQNVDLSTGVSAYDNNARSLHVFLTATASAKDPSTPYNVKVSIVGEFHVIDEARLPFPIEKIVQWAERNGAAVMLPFLRELLFSTTQKAGFTPVLIPLIEVNAFKIAPPDVPLGVQTLESSVSSKPGDLLQ